MTADQYQAEALRTCSDLESADLLAPLALGVAGEAGEVADLVKKYLMQGHPLDRQELIKELGDVLWYVTVLACWAGADLNEVMAGNVAKLRARYPAGFEAGRSRERGV